MCVRNITFSFEFRKVWDILYMSILVVCIINTVSTCRQIQTFQRNMLPSSFNPKDGDSMFPQNAGNYLQVHTALQPRRLTSTFPQP
jgi:hypothetical protein